MKDASGFKKFLDGVNKKFGKEAIVSEIVEIERIHSGSIGLDIALGGGYAKGRVIEIFGWESSGKAQPLSSKILTPNGFIEMKDIQLGDIICTPKGETSTIIGIFPQGEQDVYEFIFDDKSIVRCTLDHLWSVQSRDSILSHIMTTKEILERGLGQDHRLLKIPNISPCLFKEEKVKMNPYLLGVLLGDAALSGSIVLSNKDEELLDSVRLILDKEYDIELGEKRNNCDYGLKKKVFDGNKNGVVLDLIDLNLYNTKSESKFIPKQYLLSSIQDRIALFQGLIDTDGYIHPNQYSIQYVTVSLQLAEDFVFLARSLGMRCVMSNRINSYTSSSGNKVSGQRAYYINCLDGDYFFQPARLSRKQLKVSGKSKHSSRFIESINLVGREECQCIMIGDPDSLYITDNFVPTHNTTLALHTVAEVQKSDGRVGYIDTEHSLDLFYAASLGCNVDITDDNPSFVLSQPSNGEESVGIAVEMMKSKEFDLIIIDSVGGLIPKALLMGEVGDQKMASIARLLSQWIPALVIEANKSGCTVIFINQLRESIGVMFGNPNVTMGGNALKFFSTQRLEISRAGQNKDNEGNVISNKTRVKVIKNKVSVPFKQAEFDIVFGQGIDCYGEIVDIASEIDIIQKSGSWYSYGTTKLGQGKQAVTELLRDNPELFEELDLKVRKALQNVGS